MSWNLWVIISICIVICSILWGEYRRMVLIRRIFPTPKLRCKFVNCNQYLRMLKIVLISFIFVAQLIVLYRLHYSIDKINRDILFAIFILLVVEQILPTKRFNDA